MFSLRLDPSKCWYHLRIRILKPEKCEFELLNLQIVFVLYFVTCSNILSNTIFLTEQTIDLIKSFAVKIMMDFFLSWLRLLFGREFHFLDTLQLWDAIFADSGPPGHSIHTVQLYSRSHNTHLQYICTQGYTIHIDSTPVLQVIYHITHNYSTTVINVIKYIIYVDSITLNCTQNRYWRLFST